MTRLTFYIPTLWYIVIPLCVIIKTVHSKLDNCVIIKLFNDPSAGSPTETLLRLLLPLNSLVCHSSLQVEAVASLCLLIPYAHYNHSIGSSDGRCVQRAGT
jgi:hypothetical protein